MLTVSFVLTFLGVAAVLGLGAAFYLWQSRRRQIETRLGLAALAAMRWREFSHFVVEALQAQGFEADRLDPSAEGQKADLRLTRDGKVWLLVCKQGLNYRIAPEHVRELAGSVGLAGAAGGVIATLGTVQADARKNPHGLELLDGKAIWELVEHRLPHGLRDEIAKKARNQTTIEIALASVASLVVGAVVAFAMTPAADDAVHDALPLSQDASTHAAEGPASGTPAPAAAQPRDASIGLDEAGQRKRIIERLETLPTVDRAEWSTRSTLLLKLAEGTMSGPTLTRPICEILGEYPDLRTSRLQLQPAEGSSETVRFMQCHTY